MSDIIDRDFVPVLASIGIYFAWAVIPLVPAVIIYRLFPAAQTDTQWKVLGVALKAGGASGFYFAILALAYFRFLEPTAEYIRDIHQPFWIVEAPVMFVDAEKNVINTKSSLEHLRVEPVAYEFKKTGDQMYLVKLRFSGLKEEVPDDIRLIFPEGEGFIELRKLKTKDNTHRASKKIDLRKGKPIEIRPVLTAGQSQASIAGLSERRASGLENNERPR